jgi:hypothetical protein
MKDTLKQNASTLLITLQVAAALILIISFFLNWFRNPIFSAPGYNLPRLLEFISIPHPIDLFLTIVAFLIPVGGLAIIILTRINKSAAAISMITGMLPIILMVVLYFHHPFIPGQLATGSIMTLICAPVLLICGALESPGN